MRRTLAALVVPLLLAACGTSPPTHFFTLTAEPAAGGQHFGKFRGAPLQIRDIQLPPTVDRQALVLLGPGAQVQVLGQDRWAAPLTRLVRSTLTNDLRDRLGDKAVLSPGAPAPHRGVQVVILNVHQFAADAAGQVTLDTDWSIGRGSPPKAVISRHATIHVNAGHANAGSPPRPGAVAEAMSRALGRLADQIAAAL